MGNRFAFRLLVGVVVIATLAAAGFYGYNIGVARGLAESGHAIAPGAGPPFVYYPHPWAFGFGFFPLLFIILFWVVIVRGLFWRGWRGRGYCQTGVPPAFEEWHRRAHAQPGSPAPSGPNR